MCIYLTGDEGLDSTHILVSPIFVDPPVGHQRLQQITLYQNDYELDSEGRDRMMILPIPSYAAPGYTEDVHILEPSELLTPEAIPAMCSDIIERYNNADADLMEKYKDLRDCLPWDSERGGYDSEEKSDDPKRKLPVAKVGDYYCTVVHDPAQLTLGHLNTETLGKIDAIALQFLRSEYRTTDFSIEDQGQDQDQEEPIRENALHWKFLVCRVVDSVSKPRPIAYTHSLYRIETISAKADMRLQSMSVPTIHYHPTSQTDKDAAEFYKKRGLPPPSRPMAEFRHRILSLYGEIFAGAGVGVEQSLQQADLEGSTVRSMGCLIQNQPEPGEPAPPCVVADRTPGFYFQKMQEDLFAMFPQVRWPFIQPPFAPWFNLTESQVLLYNMEGHFKNRDIYMKVQGNLAAFSPVY